MLNSGDRQSMAVSSGLAGAEHTYSFFGGKTQFASKATGKPLVRNTQVPGAKASRVSLRIATSIQCVSLGTS